MLILSPGFDLSFAVTAPFVARIKTCELGPEGSEDGIDFCVRNTEPWEDDVVADKSDVNELRNYRECQ